MKVYLIGVLINSCILCCLFGASALRSKDRRLRCEKGKLLSLFTLLMIISLSLLSTLYILYHLSIFVGTDMVRLGIKKKKYWIYALGKILEFEYNENVFPYYIADYVLPFTRKKRDSKFYFNYGGMYYYNRELMKRHQRIKKVNR